MSGVLHVLEDDLGETGEDWFWRAFADALAGLQCRLEAEDRMDDADRRGHV